MDYDALASPLKLAPLTKRVFRQLKHAAAGVRAAWVVKRWLAESHASHQGHGTAECAQRRAHSGCRIMQGQWQT